MLNQTDSKSRFGMFIGLLAMLSQSPAMAQDNTSTFKSMPIKPTLEQCRSALAQGNVLSADKARFTVFFDAMIYVVEFSGEGMTCSAWRPVNG